jgi:two-component system cell cycle sensor histidine kinase/response regulator CckA
MDELDELGRRLREAEERLAKSEASVQALLDAVPSATMCLDPDTTRIVFANEAAVRQYGYSRTELLGMTAADFRGPNELPPVLEVGRLTASGGRFGLRKHRRKDGSFLDVEVVTHLIEVGGRSLRISSLLDVTEQREATQALRAVLANAPVTMFAIDERGIFTLSEGKGLAAAGLRPGEVVGKSALELFGTTPFKDRDGADLNGAEVLRRVLAGRPFSGLSGLGDIVYENRIDPVRDDEGRIRGAIGVATDVTDRHRAQERAREREERFRELFEHSSEGLFLLDVLEGPRFRLAALNPAEELLIGITSAASVGKLIEELFPPDLAGTLVGNYRRCLEAAEPITYTEELDVPAGRRSITSTLIPIKSPRGEIARIIGFCNDVTESRRTEEQRRQAQKMEAVGQLAGGVAHDFNNLLMVILGSADFLLETLEKDSPLRADVQEIHKASERAATLTRQLLAFSRRQVLRPRVLDLNAVLSGVGSMLRRLIGEDIEVETRPAAGLSLVNADPGQLEQVIVNLAVNARDAMSAGGKLLLETGNVLVSRAAPRDGLSAGAWVMLSVSDNGAGMDEATRARIFEPFFTTKAPGRGTGLGLSTVHGIVEQSGGHIAVSSAPGRGTSFRVYLPRDEGQAVASSGPAEPGASVNGSEVVLLVEDEDAVRALTQRLLESQGYTVFTARSGAEVLDGQVALPEEIPLLVTDLVMPGISGRELYERLRAERPKLRVLYISGYTDDELVRRGSGGAALLQKPFTAAALGAAVRRALDSPQEEWPIPVAAGGAPK